MREEELIELIGRIITEDNAADSKDSVSWNAYREAETITDKSVFPILVRIVSDHRQKKDKKIREAAYFIMGAVLRKSFDKEACIFLIDQLNEETDKYVLSAILDRLAYVSIPEEIDISTIIECSKSDKWLIRHSALYALGSSATKESREALKYYLNQGDEKTYEYEIIYSNSSLGKIGTQEDIPILMKHVDSRKRDIRESARYAIDNINSRS